MNGVTILLSVGILLLVLLGVVGYLLVVASVRANQTEALDVLQGKRLRQCRHGELLGQPEA